MKFHTLRKTIRCGNGVILPDTIFLHQMFYFNSIIYIQMIKYVHRELKKNPPFRLLSVLEGLRVREWVCPLSHGRKEVYPIYLNLRAP